MTKPTAGRRWKVLAVAAIITLLLGCLVWTSLIDGNSLQMAVMRGDTTRVRLYLLVKPDLARFRTFHNYTPLHWAAMDGRTEIARILIAKGANVNAVSIEGVSPLILAAQRGRTGIVRLLLEKGAMTEVREHHYAPIFGGRTWCETCDHETALHAAAENDHSEVMELLLAAGADVDASSGAGYTPLHLAVISDRPKAVGVLLDHGADYRAKDKEGDSPLGLVGQACVLREFIKRGIKPDNYALLHGTWSANLTLVTTALDAGIDPNCKDQDGDTALHGDANCGVAVTPDAMLTCNEPERVKIAELLITRGANVNARNKAGLTPLHVAAYTGGRKVAAVLLSHGAKAEGIHAAVGLGRISEVRDLLRANPSLLESAAMPKGYWGGVRPLEVAVINNDVEMTALLLSFGADPRAKDNDDWSPFEASFTKGRMAVFKLLMEHTQSNPSRVLSDVALYGNIEAAKYLLEHGADPNYSDRCNPPTYSAISHGHAAMLEFLLSHGAKLGETEEDQAEDASIALGQRENGVAMAEMFLARGVRPDACDLNAPLIQSAANSQTNGAVACLIRHGANARVLSRNGESALDAAHDPETIRILLQHGAKPGPGLSQGPSFLQRVRALLGGLLYLHP